MRRGVTNPLHQIADWFAFAIFMRELAPPEPAPFSPSAQRGQRPFGTDIGNPASVASSATPQPCSPHEIEALQNVPAHMYSDLLIRHMGSGLADNVTQGLAQGDAIQAHASPGAAGSGNGAPGKYPAPEATAVIRRFNALPVADKQAILDFLVAMMM